MKKIFTYYLTLSLFSLVLSEEEQIKTVEIDGTIYKVNITSLHITPYSDVIETQITDDNIMETSTDSIGDSDDSNFSLSFSLGQSFPINNTGSLDSGNGFGFTFNLPKKISLFGKDFTSALEVNSLSLSGNDGEDDVILTSTLGLLTTSVSIMNINLGFGFTHHSYYGISGSTILDLEYQLPIKTTDLSIVLRLQKVVDIDKEFNLDFDVQDVYGIYLKYGF